LAKNHYKILGINRNATLDNVRKAFRQKAKLYHPDAVGEDPEKQALFQEIVEAYEILSDPERRRRFDLLGRSDSVKQASMPATLPTESGILQFFSNLLKPKITRENFGKPMLGADMETEVSITLEESLHPCQKLLALKIPFPCPNCKGHVWLHDKPASTCPDCDGTGTKKNIGPVPFLRSCKRCDGSGKIHLTICESCNLTGLKTTEQRFEVDLPAGVENESVVRLQGLGAYGKFGGPRGDLFIKVRLIPSTNVTREGDNAFATIYIGLTDAIFGSDFQLPKPFDGTLMKIPPGAQGGQVFKLKQKGFTNLKSGRRGHLYITAQIRVPQNLEEEDKVALLKMKNRVNEL
tara:strand:- start:483 stop:1529 length:1047 start_codon:yes stop_codon:yes gene_type:complete